MTQIVRAGESEVFHNRLTHTLKVAQVGRRLAEVLLTSQPSECGTIGVDADVIEAACLAHDLGHPPFGHLGEQVLNECVLNTGNTDGFEGNAQSLRILTNLALHSESYPGLNLTAATMSACIKYPWKRAETGLASKKWGFYENEAADFSFSREDWPLSGKTAEAEIMDFADDITYSIHDLEDFHRYRLIPWYRLFPNTGIGDIPEDAAQLISSAVEKWGESAPTDAQDRLEAAYQRLAAVFDVFDFSTPYEATRAQRIELRRFTSQMVGRYINSLTLIVAVEENDSCIDIKADLSDEIRLLKQITTHFITTNYALMGQQRGHRRVLQDLFADLHDVTSMVYVPMKFRHLFCDPTIVRSRAVADCIASLTETEAMALHGRLRGYISGSVLDPIVR